MKKISVVLIFILAFLFAPAVHAEVQDTLSDEILVQAKAQADLFLELKNALGLDWLDKYNAYLQNPASKPVPTWDTSISSLINKGYLSAAFPTDFAVSISGNEAQISRNISSQAVRDAVKIYIPSATVSGNTVKLLVQRPAQWVAYESALNGKVSRDGSDSPDVLPGAQLDFGSGASISFISNDGKILGVNSLTYKGEELDTRFINASGDNMTGDLTIKGNKAWHAGNDGSGSGLDADLLDGKDSTYFTNASNMNTGTLPAARLSGTYGIDISGNAATATNANYATSAGNADTVDGKHASDFASSGHTHGQYVQKSGDTMTGNLTMQGTSINVQRPSTTGGYARGLNFTNSSGTTEAGIGMYGTGDNPPTTLYMGFGSSPWSSSAGLIVTSSNITFLGSKVWHAGNDGSGSGLDADLLDSKDSSYFTNAGNLSSGIVPVARLSGTYGIDISGTAANADKLDGYHGTDFIQKSGDTMTGTLAFNNTLSSANKLLDLQQGYAIYSDNTGGSNNTRLWIDAPNGGEVVIGPRTGANFLNDIRLRSQVISLETNGNQNGVTVNGNAVWHAGNDGSGSGLDADTIDGKHASEIGGLIPNGIKQYLTAGTYTWTKNAGTKFVLVKIWGAGAGSVLGTAGTSSFGSYVYAYGGSVTQSGWSKYISSGGSASGGDINISGKAGSLGQGGDSGNTPGSGAFYYAYDTSVVHHSAGGGESWDEVVTNYTYRPAQFGGGGYKPGWVFSGGGGGYAEKWINVSSVSSVTVVVGAGTGSGIYKGADGAVIVYEYK